MLPLFYLRFATAFSKHRQKAKLDVRIVVLYRGGDVASLSVACSSRACSCSAFPVCLSVCLPLSLSLSLSVFLSSAWPLRSRPQPGLDAVGLFTGGGNGVDAPEAREGGKGSGDKEDKFGFTGQVLAAIVVTAVAGNIIGARRFRCCSLHTSSLLQDVQDLESPVFLVYAGLKHIRRSMEPAHWVGGGPIVHALLLIVQCSGICLWGTGRCLSFFGGRQMYSVRRTPPQTRGIQATALGADASAEVSQLEVLEPNL